METQDHGLREFGAGRQQALGPLPSSLRTPALTLQAHEEAPAVERGQGEPARASSRQGPAARGCLLARPPAGPLGDRTCGAEPEDKPPTSPAHTPDLWNWEQNQMVALSRGIQSGSGFNGWSEHRGHDSQGHCTGHPGRTF